MAKFIPGISNFRVVAAAVGTQSLTNSVSTDQDYTAVYTIPANALVTNKVYRVTLMFEYVTGVSSVTTLPYLKLGSTKVFTYSAGTDLTNSVTRSVVFTYVIFGRAAPGASANVSTANIGPSLSTGAVSINSTNQPVALDTTGTLAITPGVTFSATGSTETLELQGWLVEELN